MLVRQRTKLILFFFAFPPTAHFAYNVRLTKIFQITNLLYDLGTNSSEIARNMPKMVGPMKDKKSQAKKRAQDDDGSDKLASKKSKIDVRYACYQADLVC